MIRLPKLGTILSLGLLATSTPLRAQTGPLIGSVETDKAWLLYHPGDEVKNLRLTALSKGQVVASAESTSLEENNYVAKFQLEGLSPATTYQYRIDEVTDVGVVPLVGPEDGLQFKTALPRNQRAIVTAGFVSCANASSEPIWQKMNEIGVDYLFLGGDTPYIDTGDLSAIRSKHRAFLQTPFISQLIRKTPTVATWDDHDFGLNNGNGASVSYKDLTRQGFIEYRAHAQYGNGTGGVYHKLDTGVMEVFLLDPRYFSQTEPSPVDPDQRTCFGADQWQWIRESLLASKATFKVLMMGQIWQDKKNGETDDMFTYWYERDALLDFVKENQIPGVVLVGGDIHVSRHLIHPQRVGYDLHDFITSPAHSSVIASLDVPHPDLEWSSQQARQFLTLSADTRPQEPVLTARYYLADGTIQREIPISYKQLTPQSGAGLGKDLRAWWNFDEDFSNNSILGERIDASPENGASRQLNGGLRGAAAAFSLSDSQYLNIPRSLLDDNSAAHTVSVWIKPSSLPAHASPERQFILESTKGGPASSSNNYHLSLGMRTSDDPDKINLQVYTITLEPAAAVGAAPSTEIQGPFDCLIDRSALENRWSHLAMTFDSREIQLWLNGSQIASHSLPIPGPAAEWGGLVIGGHREGTGRNFDGLIDELAIWQRALTAAEISTLHGSGNPPSLPTSVSVLDHDSDSLPDWYESLHDLNPMDPADALSDLDQDGLPAFLEYQSGLHPNQDDSQLLSYLRQYTCGKAEPPQLIFSHPADKQIHARFALQSTRDLVQWDTDAEAELATLDPLTLEFQPQERTNPMEQSFFRAHWMP
ncbi:MAG: LamG-like jellyroll fold domain-containing protein [Luteolibacter sp.]